MQIAEKVGSTDADVVRPASASEGDYTQGNIQGHGDANGGVAPDVDAKGLTELLHALQAMRVGDFSVRMAGDRIGLLGKLADTFNEIAATNQRMARQLESVGQVVGRDAALASASVSAFPTVLGVKWRRASIRSSTICCGRRPK